MKEREREDYDLLDDSPKVENRDRESLTDKTARSLDQMRSKLESEDDLANRQKILDSTLETVKDVVEDDRNTMLEDIKNLVQMQEELGLTFEDFNAFDDHELEMLERAQKALERAEKSLENAKNRPDNWWTRLLGREGRIKRARTRIEEMKIALSDTEDEVKEMQRRRLEESGMKELLDEYAHKSRVISERLKNRESEILEVETDIKATMKEANAIHSKALSQQKEVDTELEETDTALNRAQDELKEISDKHSPAYADQLEAVTDLEQKVQELKGRRDALMSLAASKDSFVHKHNLTLKVLTTTRSNLRSHRTKLSSDTTERVQYYEGYVTALKARSDQEMADVLERLGVKQDEQIAETLSSYLVASSKARQDMMKNIPKHERKMASIYATLAEGVARIRKEDKEIRESFNENYGVDVETFFEKSYSGDEEPESVEEDESPKGSDSDGDDLLD